MNTLFAGILLTCIVLFVYHHLIYPVLVAICAALMRTVRRPLPTGTSGALPSITILVPARNEAKVIASKIVNLLATDYPSDKLSIIIALDGCTDGTRRVAEETIAKVLTTPSGRQTANRIRIVEYPANIGKVAVLNQQISQVNSEIVVLTDASAALAADAVRRAVRHFADATVGVVAPTYNLVRAGSEGEQAYTNYLTRLRCDEAELDSPLGCHGACYLFRRTLWTPLPADTINDDFMLPLRIVSAGYRGVYDTSIVALELETTSRPQEFRRRVRIGAGNMQQSVRLAGLLDPRRPWLAFMFASGKGVRPFMPFVAVLGGLAALGLAINGCVPFSILILCGAMASAAIASLVARPSRPRAATWFVYFIEGYAASLVGAVKFLAGQSLGAWQPNEAQAPGVSPNLVWPTDQSADTATR